MAIAKVTSVVITFSVFGMQKPNYVVSVERMKMSECLIVQKGIDKHHKVECLTDTEKKKGVSMKPQVRSGGTK